MPLPLKSLVLEDSSSDGYAYLKTFGLSPGTKIWRPIVSGGEFLFELRAFVEECLFSLNSLAERVLYISSSLVSGRPAPESVGSSWARGPE